MHCNMLKNQDGVAIVEKLNCISNQLLNSTVEKDIVHYKYCSPHNQLNSRTVRPCSAPVSCIVSIPAFIRIKLYEAFYYKTSS